MVDCEFDGPAPGLYSLIEIGAVLVSDPKQTFYGSLRPISEKYVQGALDSIGRTREETFKFDDPLMTMERFNAWIKGVCGKDRPGFISDNNGADWQFVNWYFWNFLNQNPFGHSSQNLGGLYKGIVRDMHQNFKFLRKSKHDHNPVNDAMGNVEALLHMKTKMGLKGI